MKRSLGNLERQLFAYVQMRNIKTLKTGDLCAALGISPVQERKLYSRLAQAGMIAQVRRGLYLIPQRLPLGGKWTPDEILALNTLLNDKNGRYQICGPSAFNRYGFDEQIPVRVFAYNNRLSGDDTVGSIALTLIKVADERLGDVDQVKTADGEIGFYSSRPRALLDAVYDWSRFNSLPRAYRWIQNELASKCVLPKELVEVTLKYGDVGTIRRMGYFLEKIGIQDRLLSRLRRRLKPTTAFIRLNPNQPKRGTVDYPWGILDNEDR
jgi:predicted transcriptional regulator of viral defense system